jgi:hypothetical protein
VGFRAQTLLICEGELWLACPNCCTLDLKPACFLTRRFFKAGVSAGTKAGSGLGGTPEGPGECPAWAVSRQRCSPVDEPVADDIAKYTNAELNTSVQKSAGEG